MEHHVKAKVTVATGEQIWLGRLFSVDALNMLERFDAGSRAGRHDGGSCNLTPDPWLRLGKRPASSWA
jgi:hypothetical protein